LEIRIFVNVCRRNFLSGLIDQFLFVDRLPDPTATMKTKLFLVILIAVIILILFSARPPTTKSSHISTQKNSHANAFANFKHHGPRCEVSSVDLYEPRSIACSSRASMLGAMSSGGRIGKDSPYTARGCDIIWYTTEEVCAILGRFSQIMLVGDSMLRHIMGALNILIREDLGYGAVTDWNFNREER
jgi:hypothetical protein